MNKQNTVEYIKSFPDKSLHSSIIDNHNSIETWFRRQWIKYPPPFYSSVDIRNSGFKILGPIFDGATPVVIQAATAAKISRP